MSSVVRINESGVPGAAPAFDHRVQFFDGDEALATSVSGFILEGLGSGEGCVVVATAPHRRELEVRASRAGVDLGAFAASGQYVPLDAEETLSRFMGVDGPDPRRFADVIGPTLRRAASGGRPVRAFGEMVALLWAAGKREDTIRLEELWNDLAADHAFSLLCAYPLAAFPRDSDASGLRMVCDTHSRVLPAESYAGLADSDSKLRAITELQQKAASLEAEVRDRESIQAKLTRREMELSDFLENAVEGLHRVGPDGTILWANRAELDLLGWSAEEYIGHSIADFHVERHAIDDILRRLLAGETLRDCPATLRCKDGSVKHVLIHSNGFWEHGRFVYSRCFTRDISDRKRLEDELKMRVAELAREDRRKDEFLASLAHELRNPIAPLRMSVRLIRAHPGEAEVARHLDVIDRQSANLAHIVDDLLDVSRVTTGKIELRLEPLDIMTVVSRAVDSVRPVTDQYRHDVSVSLPRGTVFVMADPVRLEQVIVNLLTNAAKYTPPGGRIRISVERHGKAAEIRVKDNGLGIEPAMLDRVFDLFHQGLQSPGRSNGGLGIGLTITRRLVELHGGTVHALSGGPGRGSEFIVRLTAVAAHRSPQAEEVPILTPVPGDPLRILVVDDNTDAGEALAQILQDDGNEVRMAFQGEAALEVAAVFHPNLILLDIGLPGMDGHEVARRLRANRVDAMLVAVTGYGQKADRDAAAAAGFDEHIVKPVELEKLARVIARAQAAAKAPTPWTLPPDPFDSRPN